jgi:hypothetical protein
MIDRSQLDDALQNPPTLRAEATAEDARQQAIIAATAAQQAARQRAAQQPAPPGPPAPAQPCAECQQAQRIQLAVAIASGVALGAAVFWVMSRGGGGG